MKQTWQKGSALLVVCVMMISTLVALISAPVVVANEAISTSTFEIEVVWDDNWMIDDPAVLAADEPDDEQIVFNYDNAASSLYYLGDNEATIRVTFDRPGEIDTNGSLWQHNRTWNNTDVTCSLIAPTDSLVTPGDTGVVVVDGDTTAVASVGGWGNINGDNATAWEANTQLVIDFSIDIGDTGDIETSYPLTVFIEYTDDGGVNPITNVHNESLEIEVYVSTVFHEDDTNMNRDTSFEYVYTNGGASDVFVFDNTGGTDDAALEAGDSFEPARFTVELDAGFTIDDPLATMTSPTGITLIRDTAQSFGTSAIGNINFNYRVDIDARLAPGIYQGTVMFDFIRTDMGFDLPIHENAMPIDFIVDFSFLDDDATPDTFTYSEFQCRAIGVEIVDETTIDNASGNGTRLWENVPVPTPPTIEQSTYTDETIQVAVKIENNGNTALYNVEYKIDPAAWPNFRNPQFFWAEDGASYFDDLSLFVPFLGIGENITFIIKLTVVNDIPIGEHRLPIVYNGYYFNDGSLLGATSYVATSTDLNVIFSIFVDDQAISCHAVVTAPPLNEAGGKQSIRANQITVAIHNDEGYNFIDVTVQANFNNTPWYNPIINMGNPLVWANAASPAVPHAAWGAGLSFDAVFDVDTDPDLVPDRYPFSLEITAVIEETLQQVSVVIDYTRGATIDFTGYGPELLITAFSAEDIVPGDYFELEMTITNLGDDTARDLFVSFIPDDTEVHPGGWDFEYDFKDQFNWEDVFADWGSETGGSVAWENSEFPSDMFYTMESLDVDNIREIVEINLYAEGVYSTPGSTIMVIKITDLAPGQNTTVTFTMIADKDMVNGKPYAIPVYISGIDPDGGSSIVPGTTQTIEVMSSLPGETYNPIETDWFDTGVKALSLLLFLVIVIAILLMVFSRFKGDADDYDEDDDEFGFEDDEDDYEPMGMDEEDDVPAPPMDAPMEAPEAPPAAPEELVEP